MGSLADNSFVADLHLLNPNPFAQTPTLASLVHDRLDPQAILNAIVRSVAGVTGAALATADGRSVAHSDHLLHDPGRSAMIAATMGLAGGRVPERTNGPVSKTVEAFCVSVGSNPTPSANGYRRCPQTVRTCHRVRTV